MKQFLFSTALFLLIPGLAKAQPAPVPVPESAESIMKSALKEAARDNKKVFIMFHASWCGWCHRMDNSMNDPACKKFFEDNFVIRHLVVDESKDKLNLENPGADEMRVKYHGEGQGIPFWLIFDKEGKLLSDSKLRNEGEGQDAGQNVGCPANEAEVNYFIEVLKKTTAITADQEAQVRKRFRQNQN